MTVRVLQVCPFSIPDEPSSGGQIRITAIQEAYQAAGCLVDRCCIVTRARDVRNPLDLVMTWPDRIRRYHIGKPGNLGQIRQHWAAEKSQRLQKQLAKKLTAHYDLVHVEHPWDAELIHQLRNHASLRRARIISSSHNVERELFESVVQERDEWNGSAKRLAQDIGRIELNAAARADLIWAVSKHDANKLAQSGTPFVVAPNGCRPLPSNPRDETFSSVSRPYALFVGANYGPNVNGFLNMLGDDFGFLPKGTSLHTIGTCGEFLSKHEPHQSWIHSGALAHHGRVSQATLDSALHHASVIILPITAGGGTNLKTAEALATNHPILGTSHSFRGFEDWTHADRVWLEDSPTTFRSKLADLLTRTPCASEKHTLDTAALDLTWSNVLRPAIDATLALIQPT